MSSSDSVTLMAETQGVGAAGSFPSDGLLDRPKRPLSAYNLFFSAQRNRMIRDKSMGKDVDMGGLAKTIGQLWNQASPQERAPFEALAREEKVRYKQAVTSWRKSLKDSKKRQKDAEKKRSNSAPSLMLMNHHGAPVSASRQPVMGVLGGTPQPTLLVANPGSRSMLTADSPSDMHNFEFPKTVSLESVRGQISSNNTNALTNNAQVINFGDSTPSVFLQGSHQQTHQAPSQVYSSSSSRLLSLFRSKTASAISDMKQNSCLEGESFSSSNFVWDAPQAEHAESDSVRPIDFGRVNNGIERLADQLEPDCVDWLADLFKDDN